MSQKFNLTEIQMDVLRRTAQGKFNADFASRAEQEAEMQLIEMASQYEEEHDLIDERMDYTENCSLLVWFHDKVIMTQ